MCLYILPEIKNTRYLRTWSYIQVVVRCPMWVLGTKLTAQYMLYIGRRVGAAYCCILTLILILIEWTLERANFMVLYQQTLTN